MTAAEEYVYRLNDGSARPQPTDNEIWTKAADAVIVGTFAGSVVLTLRPGNHSTQKAVQLTPTDARVIAWALIRAAAAAPRPRGRRLPR
jgi:hypothetical protein